MQLARMVADLQSLASRHLRLMLERAQGPKVLLLDSETTGIVACTLSQSEILQKEVRVASLIRHCRPQRRVVRDKRSWFKSGVMLIGVSGFNSRRSAQRLVGAPECSVLSKTNERKHFTFAEDLAAATRVVFGIWRRRSAP